MALPKDQESFAAHILPHDSFLNNNFSQLQRSNCTLHIIHYSVICDTTLHEGEVQGS